MIEVTVTIDFGPAGRPPVEAVVLLVEKSTVLEALLARFMVITVPKYGMDHFIEEIDHVKNDFLNDRGWRFEVNGRSSNVPAERYLVKHGDWIKWSYVDGGCK
jgi:Domain of unknown function (DUF4430)